MEGGVNYLSFHRSQNDGGANNSTALYSKFIAEPNNKKLADILKKHRKSVAVKFYECELDGVYLVVMRGKYDGILIELGKDYNFPRGFPVLWDSNTHEVRYFGFLPKFYNDERQLLDDFSHSTVKSIRFFKKWSGFLGQLLVFQIGGRKWWTACSKNDAGSDSEFVQIARQLFEPFITEELADRMIADKLHICAEMMSVKDQCHGAIVLKESPVITVIGRPAVDPNTQFVSFLDQSDVVDFCVKYSLPCDSAVMIDGEEECRKFLCELSQSRDFMDNNALNQLLTQSDHVRVQSGTVTHAEILGNVLEGLVLHLTHTDGRKETKKYKFPGYTVRTMLFRECFRNTDFNESDETPFVLSVVLKTKVRRFISFWCVSDEGKRYWFQRGLLGMMMYSAGFISKYPTTQSVHIEIADYIEHEYHNDMTFEAESKFDALVRNSIHHTVVIVVGPIGSGKSTIASKLGGSDQRFTIIDGDVMGLEKEVVLKMGQERNPFTVWKVIEALMMGKVPVLSTGGGALTRGRFQNIIIRDAIRKTLGINVQLVILACNSSVTEITEMGYADTNLMDQCVDEYKNTENVESVVTRRVNDGDWNLDSKFVSKNSEREQQISNFAKFISKKSTGNSKFCEKLLAEGDYCFAFPLIRPENYSDSLDFSRVTRYIPDNIPENVLGKFQQTRVLVRVQSENGSLDKIHHITLRFDEERKELTPIAVFDKFDKMWCTGNPVTGGVWTLCGGQSKKSPKIMFALPDQKLHFDDSTHVTIDPGCHEPKLMRPAAVAVVNGKDKVQLVPKNGKGMITYTINRDTDSSPCQITFLKIFGI